MCVYIYTHTYIVIFFYVITFNINYFLFMQKVYYWLSQRRDASTVNGGTSAEHNITRAIQL